MMNHRLTNSLLAVWTTLASCSPAPAPAVPPAPLMQPSGTVASAATPPAPASAVTAPKPTTSIRHRVTGAGPDLVLVHGNFDRMETWDAALPALTTSFRVLTLDLVGYGETPNPSGRCTIETFADGVLEVMNAEGVGSAILVGNSMGGAVVSHIAGSAPARVSGLVLEDANFLPTGMLPEMGARLGPVIQAAMAWKQQPSDAGLQKATRDAVAEALRLALPTKGVVTDKVIDHFTAGFDPQHVDTVLTGQKEFGFSRVADEVAAARKTRAFPVLILWGSADPLIPVRAADAAHQKLEGSRLVIFEGCGHAPHLERTEEFVAALKEGFGAGAKFPAEDRLLGQDGSARKLESGWLEKLTPGKPAAKAGAARPTANPAARR